MIRIIILSILLVSCAHQNSYYQIDKADNKLSSVSSFRSPSSDKESKDVAKKCYQNPKSIDLKELYKMGEQQYQDISYWITLSTCLKEKSQYSESYQILKRALTMAKSKVEKEAVYNNLLVLSLTKKNLFLAKTYINILKGYSNLSALTYFNMGNFYLTSMHYLQAKIYFSHALSKAPGDLDITLGLIRTNIGLKKYKEALKEITKINPKYFKRSDIAITYAYALFKLNYLSKAKEVVGHISKYYKNEDEIAERYLKLIEKTLKRKDKKKS